MKNNSPASKCFCEVAMSVDHLRWFAEEARRAYGRVIPPQVEGKRHLTVKRPVGVVGAISPWNFPLVLAVRKIAPALAAGCPVVLKPASQTPLCALLFAECCHAAKVPPGVFQVVLGSARKRANPAPDAEELSEEDQQLKNDLEMMVERVAVSAWPRRGWMDHGPS